MKLNKGIVLMQKWAVEMQTDNRVPYGIGKNENYNKDALKWK